VAARGCQLCGGTSSDDLDYDGRGTGTDRLGGTVHILGVNYYFHDSTACVVVDGKIVVAM
jgi:hypothetical protein